MPHLDPIVALRFAILNTLHTYGMAAQYTEQIARYVRAEQREVSTAQVSTELHDLAGRGYVENRQRNPMLPDVWRLLPAGRDQVEFRAAALDPAIHGDLALGGQP